MPRRLVILGSTGSIGTQALDLVAANPERFEVVGLGAGGGRPDLLAEQARRFDVASVAVASDDVRLDVPAGTSLLAGAEACADLATTECDVVLNAMTGAVGLTTTLAALEAGRTVALANKESLVIGGQLVIDAATDGPDRIEGADGTHRCNSATGTTVTGPPARLVPVDSEHAAIAQCLRSGGPDEVRRLVLTASGGPFRGRSRTQLAGITVDQALAHPTWNMGPVITINSATLVNKGLELIEAHLLFGVEMNAIDVVVHPQSRIHSMVEFRDGATIAQASPPSMAQPIAMALAWPDRVPDAQPGFDWAQAQSWTFEPLDDDVFPAVALARAAGEAGGVAPAVYNAANEVAVQAFRDRRLPFTGIDETITAVLGAMLPEILDPGRQEQSAAPGGDVRLQVARPTLETVLAADDEARSRAAELIEEVR